MVVTNIMNQERYPGNDMMLLYCKCRQNLFYHVRKGNQSCCTLCGSVKDVTYCKNLLNKANEELHATAEAVYGRSTTHLIITSE